MKKTNKNQKGQALVEYIIIIVVVAMAALGIMGMFSDTIQSKMAGVINTFGGVNGEKVDDVNKGDSQQTFSDLKSQGLD